MTEAEEEEVAIRIATTAESLAISHVTAALLDADQDPDLVAEVATEAMVPEETASETAEEMTLATEEEVTPETEEEETTLATEEEKTLATEEEATLETREEEKILLEE